MSKEYEKMSLLDELDEKGLDLKSEIRQRDDERRSERHNNSRNNHSKTYDNRDRDNDKKSRNDSSYLVKAIGRTSELFVEKKRNEADSLEDFAKKLLDPRFAASLYDTICKDNDDDDDDSSKKFSSLAPFASFVYETVVLHREQLQQEHADALFAVVEKLIKPRSKEIGKRFEKKKDRPAKELLDEAALVVPIDSIINPRYNIFALLSKLNTQIYVLAGEGIDDLNMHKVKSIKKIYTAIFEDVNLPNVAVGCLLERQSSYNSLKDDTQKEIWDNITEFALDTLNELDKRELFECLKQYTFRRYCDDINRVDSARRLNLKEFAEKLKKRNKDKDKNEYSNIIKTIERMSEDRKFIRFLN